MSDKMTYNKILNDCADRYNLTNIQIADWLNVTPTMVSLWRNRHHRMNPKKYFYPFIDKLEDHLKSLSEEIESLKEIRDATNKNN